MYIKNRYISAVYKLAVSACGIIGIQLQLSLFSGSSANWEMFRFFTNLSNLACVLYFLIAAFWLIGGKTHDKTTFCPVFKSIIMMSIIVTMLVAQFMLSGFDMNGTQGTALILLHRVVPIMTVLDWLLFDQKGWMTKFSPLFGVSAPLVYFAYSLIAAATGSVLQDGSKYPYPFIDIDTLGVSTVALTVTAMVAGFIVLGYILYFIDYRLAKFSKKRDRVE